MKILFSKDKPKESGHYFLKSGNFMEKVYVGQSMKTSSWFDFPFNYGLSVQFKNGYGNTENVPLEWIYGEWSEKIEF